MKAQKNPYSSSKKVKNLDGFNTADALDYAKSAVSNLTPQGLGANALKIGGGLLLGVMSFVGYRLYTSYSKSEKDKNEVEQRAHIIGTPENFASRLASLINGLDFNGEMPKRIIILLADIKDFKTWNETFVQYKKLTGESFQDAVGGELYWNYKPLVDLRSLPKWLQTGVKIVSIGAAQLLTIPFSKTDEYNNLVASMARKLALQQNSK